MSNQSKLYYSAKDLELRGWMDDRFYVGQIFTRSVAAPGTGYNEYEVTAVTEEFIFVKLINSTVRELTLADII